MTEYTRTIRRGNITLITHISRREYGRRIMMRVLIACFVIAALIGSGIAETQRLNVMDATSSEATMAQMGISQ